MKVDNFKFIYYILRELEEQMDKDTLDTNRISCEQFGISQIRWIKYLEMMVDTGLVKNVSIKKNLYDEYIYDIDDMKITLKGLEYLQENSIMQKMYKVAKGIKEVTPMI